VNKAVCVCVCVLIAYGYYKRQNQKKLKARPRKFNNELIRLIVGLADRKEYMDCLNNVSLVQNFQ